MDIVVLAKQVPDTESLVKIADDNVSINTDNIKWAINPYDEIALEEALRIRDAKGGTVTVLSVGPQRTEKAIRTSLLAMGADKGVLICDPLADGSDALATAKILAAALNIIDYDLIIAGQRAVDQDNYQVGPAVAELLGIPQITQVIKEEISDNKIRCHQVVEGAVIIVEASLPALFTTQRGLNEPRYTSMPGIMKAKKKPIDIKTLADIGIDPETVGSANVKVEVAALALPPERQAVKMVAGDSSRDKASALIKILHENVKVL